MTFEIKHLTYTLKKRHLIQDISIRCEPGQLIGILGPNGSGKSTLLKTTARIWTPTSGQVYWQGKDLLRYSREELSSTLSLVPQNPQLYFDFTVYTLAAMGRYPIGTRSPDANQRLEEALRQVDAWHLRHQLVAHLSGGERQRVYIARALATQAPILLLDEPTSYLDLRHQLEIWELLRKLVEQGKLVIVALHDLIAAQRFCDEIVILSEGCCVGKGSYEKIMTPQLLKDIFGVSSSKEAGLFNLSLSDKTDF